MTLAAAAIGIIFNHNKTEVLLVKRKDVPIWVLPGGGIDALETPEHAVIREVFEETGLNISIERKSGEYTPLNKLGAFTNVFICKIEGGNIGLSDETADVQFYPLNQLPSLFFPIHQQWLEDSLTHSQLVKSSIKGLTYRDILKYIYQHPWYTLRYLWTRLTKH